MAQPSGYLCSDPQAAGMDDPLGPSLIPNGQPPQWTKPPALPAKYPRPPYVGHQLASPSLAASNGTPTPTPQNYSNPGSLSSHSSRNPSPVPHRHGVGHSFENLTHSSPDTNSHVPQYRTAAGTSPIPQTQSTSTLSPSPLLRNSGPETVKAHNSLKANSGIVATNVHQMGSPKTAFSEVPQPNKQISHANIPSQPVSHIAEEHRENQSPLDPRESVSAHMRHGSSFTSVTNTSYTSQVYTQPLVAPQVSVNGPPMVQQQQHKNYMGGHFSSPPGISSSATRMSVQSAVQAPPTSQQGQFSSLRASAHPPNSHPTPTHPSLGTPNTVSVTKPFMTPGSLTQPPGPGGVGMHIGAGRPPIPSLSQPMQYPTSRAAEQLPRTQPMQYMGMLPMSSLAPATTVSPNQHSQYPSMPPLVSSSGQSPVFQQTPHYPNPQSAGPPLRFPLGAPPPPVSAPGLGHTSTSQSPLHPGMPPSSSGYSLAGMMPPPPPLGASKPGQQPHYGAPPVSSVADSSSMPITSQYHSAPNYPQPGMPSAPSTHQSGDGHHPLKRDPQQPGYSGVDGLSSQMSNLSVTQAGFNKLWGLEYYDLLQTRNILPPEKIEAPKVRLHQEFLDNVNCSPDIFRCTLTKIPESNSLLQKSRLPLGILVHPFKDLNHLPVIQCGTIVRCRACRTYINPFVYFLDHKRWKCNLCFRVNELPEEFQYDPVSKTYGDPTRRPEIKSSTMEFIAPSEYMLRPPQPAVYLFLLDVSQLAIESGYLQLVCDILLDELDRLPGDGRMQVGFVTFDSNVHFYNLAEGLSQPQQMIVVDMDDIFLPCPDNLLVNLAESRDLVRDLLHQLPVKFQMSHDMHSALGPALQAAFKLMSPTGGRVTVFQSCLPTVGPGSLTSREDPSQRAGKEAPHLNPAIDFYKRLALDCSGQQVAVDLFIINSQYCDLATVSGVSRFSGGCIHHFPLFKVSNALQAEHLERVFRRYLSRKIGFEAVMRIRCSRGLAIHTFHGNFFVRSTDLLSLPNVNPDAGFGMQVSVEESLSEVQNVCFQAALLYTTSKGERRIRVHTLCLPVATTLPEILNSADQQCIIGLLAKMAVDRSHQTSLSDAREAFINVAIDVLSAYRLVQCSGAATGLLAPHNLRLLPLYILALLKYVAFRTGQSTRLDDRLFAMCQMKTLPLSSLIQTIYPDLYPLHCLEEQLIPLDDGTCVPQPPRLHLSAEKLDQRGVFLLDSCDHMLMYVGHNISAEFCAEVFGVPSFAHIPDKMYDLPVLETQRSENMRNFIAHLQSERPFYATLEIIRDDSPHRSKFTERLIEDRTESALSYYEFLQHLKTNVK